MDPESENVPPDNGGEPAVAEGKAVEEHENLPRLGACAVKLEGEVVLPAPRVSREALISVLKEHNDILTLLRADLVGVTSFLQEVATQAAETRAQVARIDAEVQHQRGDLAVLSQRTDAMEEINAELGAKLEAIDDMQAAIASQGLHLAALQGGFDDEQATNATFRSTTEERMEAEALRTASLEQTREQMQERLDHMHEEIHITADQITFTRCAPNPCLLLLLVLLLVVVVVLLLLLLVLLLTG
jgi:chromosome segregation ATPase